MREKQRHLHILAQVPAGFGSAYASVVEAKNSAYLGRGLVFSKYTGLRGKSGSNDASAEYPARIRRVMDDAGMAWQTAELGKVDAGGVVLATTLLFLLLPPYRAVGDVGGRAVLRYCSACYVHFGFV